MSNLIDRDEVLTLLNIVRQDPSQIDNAIDDILSLPLQQWDTDFKKALKDAHEIGYRKWFVEASSLCNESRGIQQQWGNEKIKELMEKKIQLAENNQNQCEKDFAWFTRHRYFWGKIDWLQELLKEIENLPPNN